MKKSLYILPASAKVKSSKAKTPRQTTETERQKMKYRIEPKPQGRTRFRPFMETEDIEAVRAWVANPPIAVTARVYGTDGTHWSLATPSYHDIVVSEFRADPARMDDCDNIPKQWRPCAAVSTVASLETEAGCRQVERWQGKPPGTYTPRLAYDR